MVIGFGEIFDIANAALYTDRQRLFEALAKAGWTWRDGSLYAPNGTMWLSEDLSWVDDFGSFRDRMTERADRIKAYLDGSPQERVADSERALDDTVGLVDVLNRLLK
jgi:hypothetical protein